MRAVAVVVDHLQRCALAGDLRHAQFGLLVAGQVQELVGMPVLILDHGHLVERTALVGPGLEVLAVALPEVLRQRVGAGVEQAEIVQRAVVLRSEEHTSELQSLMRISYAVFCLKKKKKPNKQ